MFSGAPKQYCVRQTGGKFVYKGKGLQTRRLSKLGKLTELSYLRAICGTPSPSKMILWRHVINEGFSLPPHIPMENVTGELVPGYGMRKHKGKICTYRLNRLNVSGLLVKRFVNPDRSSTNPIPGF